MLMNNFLYIISNISPYFNKLHISSSQSLINLLTSLIKIVKKVINKNDENVELIKFLQIILEILNYFVFFNLKNNITLLYELLRSKEANLLTYLMNLNIFPNLVSNLLFVIDKFYSKINFVQSDSISSIYDSLVVSTENFSANVVEIKVFEHLKYNYDESNDAESFFYDIIWDFIIQNNYDQISFWNEEKLFLLRSDLYIKIEE
jgi:hypothetical protein